MSPLLKGGEEGIPEHTIETILEEVRHVLSLPGASVQIIEGTTEDEVLATQGGQRGWLYNGSWWIEIKVPADKRRERSL